ncbi:hypothetical protein QUW15_08380, partial [Desulfovibrio piger]|nr:hypothetical protein [Desulfovibrio piger]
SEFPLPRVPRLREQQKQPRNGAVSVFMARRRRSVAWQKQGGKTALFPRNDRSYGLRRAAFSN